MEKKINTGVKRGTCQPRKKMSPPNRAARAQKLREQRKSLREQMKEYVETISYYRKLDKADDINDAAFGPEVK
jgi:hypothetical protein